MIKLSKFMASTTSTLTSIYAEHVTMAEKIGKCMPNLNEKSKRFWQMEWKPEFGDKIKDNAGRIYLIVSRAPEVDGVKSSGVIMKIGKSECRGGMKSTFSFYQSGLTGSPSIRSFGIHHLIKEEMSKGNKVEIYGIWSTPVKVKVPGLFETEEMEVTPSIHCMEDKCRKDYKKIMGDYPPWNFQERGAPWPKHILELYKAQVEQRGGNSNK